jgi:hypothetical protein
MIVFTLVTLLWITAIVGAIVMNKIEADNNWYAPYAFCIATAATILIAMEEMK